MLVRRWASPGVVHLPVLDPVEPARAQPLWLSEGLEIRKVVSDSVENQVDRHSGKVGPDAVVRPGSAETYVQVRATHDVERIRVIEDILIEVG